MFAQLNISIGTQTATSTLWLTETNALPITEQLAYRIMCDTAFEMNAIPIACGRPKASQSISKSIHEKKSISSRACNVCCISAKADATMVLGSTFFISFVDALTPFMQQM